MDKENKYGTLEIQLKLLELLKIFDEFCIENSVKYSLSGGSLLGAIRHKGFIPWDDDLDVQLDRENYELLIEKIKSCKKLRFKKRLWIYRITLPDSYNQKNQPTLDIFVFDKVPDSYILKKLKIFLIYMLQGMMKEEPRYHSYTLAYKFCAFVTYWMGKLVPTNIKECLYDNVSKIGNRRKSHKVTCYNTLFKYVKLEFIGEFMENIERVAFEDTEASATSSYDHYLTVLYGDYMKPPVEKDRIPQHI